ncbi:response regulator [Marinifilum sp. N1E240]|uniref:sigma-54-dependent transcriptional regulator n=1 Tax=Marinifilum sp. N1E240 TaxID=2608082 RepID=UPI00128DF654|nr:sigma-54 dependent transcriptional regulator [Marinifilum sp. N1E240]MPQ46054.1 response regulator [Marinifilum sp. N1E240]
MNKKGKLLIIDDNKSVLKSLQLFLKHHFKELVTCNNPNQIPGLMLQNEFDVILLDMNFSAGVNSGNEGLYWLKEIRKRSEHTVVVLFTAYGDVNVAVNSMKHGATDFILKPWDNKKLLATLVSGVELYRTRVELDESKQQRKLLENDLKQIVTKMIGESDAIRNVRKMIDKVAQTDANVLILGENGTGKEIVAREIHNKSKRQDKIFMSVDMGSLSESIFESELFGHIKGAFTDAKENRKGRFQAATGGSLFLDEIGNLSSTMQSKLLSVLQNRKVTPLGSNKEDNVDIRLISATNANLIDLVDEGLFREDLLYRINTVVIEMPPLRDRGKDILLLADYYLKKFVQKYGKQLMVLNEEVKALLLSYTWPGNIRELSHCMERAVILNDKKVLELNDFQLDNKSNTNSIGDKAISLEEAEKILIESSMRRNKGNISHVARELNIGRQTLYRKIEKYNLL